MKPFLIIWNVVLTLLVGFLLWTYGMGMTTTAQPEEEIVAADSSMAEELDTLPVFSGPIAFVNNDSLLDGYTFYQESKEQLKTANENMQNRYQREVEKFEKEYLELQEKARFMTQSQGEAAQQRLMQRQQEIMKMEQDLTQEAAELEMEKLQDVKDRISDYLERYQDEMGYTIVFGRSSLGGIHFADSDLDITKQVMKGLNEEYELEKNPPKEEQ